MMIPRVLLRCKIPGGREVEVYSLSGNSPDEIEIDEIGYSDDLKGEEMVSLEDINWVEQNYREDIEKIWLDLQAFQVAAELEL